MVDLLTSIISIFIIIVMVTLITIILLLTIITIIIIMIINRSSNNNNPQVGKQNHPEEPKFPNRRSHGGWSLEKKKAVRREKIHSEAPSPRWEKT